MGAARDPVADALAAVRLFVLDVDGTLTDGRVAFVGAEEQQTFDVRDGQGLAWLRRAEVELAWITGRGCRATEVRAAELGVRELHLLSGPKAEVLTGVQQRLGIPPAETIAMGDDLVDLALCSGAALFCAPVDAHPVVRERAGLVTVAAGGRGAVREVCEAILRAKGLWSTVLRRYGGDSR